MSVGVEHIPPAGAEFPDLPIFPLNTVLFPAGRLPLRIFEQRYIEMAKSCLKENAPFGVCLIRSGREVGTPATPEPFGCTARIVEWDMQQLGVLSVVTHGEQRLRIHAARVTGSGLTRASIEMIAAESDARMPSKFAACAKLLRSVIEQNGEAVFASPLRLDSSSWVGARLAEILPLPLAAKQRLLELNDALQRIEILHDFLLQNGIAEG